MGLDRRFRERDRRLVGGAARLAGVRDAVSAPPAVPGRSVGSRRVSDTIPLALPVMGAEEEARVLEVMRSGRLSLGPVLTEFEERFAAWLGAAHASAVSSGTAGLHLALR